MVNSALIRMVRDHKCLWDHTVRDYHSRECQRQSWEEISAELGIPAEDLRKKWRTLRDTFVRELKKLHTTEREPESKWVLFKELLFLQSSVVTRKESSNQRGQTVFVNVKPDANDSEWENSRNDTICFDYNPSLPSTPPRQVSPQHDEPINVIDALGNGIRRRNKRPRSEDNALAFTIDEKNVEFVNESADDSDTQFLLSLRPYLNDVPKHRKLIVRTKIEQVLIGEQNM